MASWMMDYIVDVPNFPIRGVGFKDISPLLASKRFTELTRAFAEIVDLQKADAIAGIESRGFILGAALAQFASKGFVPLRKKDKLPPPVESLSYKLEYGTATLEIKRGQGRVILIDDVLATGGTLEAAVQLCGQAGFEVVDVAVLIDLRFLNAFRFKGAPAKSLVVYER